MYLRKPEWLRKQIFDQSKENDIKKIIKEHNLHTVCSEARCPNLCECFKSGTATFLLLGSICTRNCSFCNISGRGGDLTVDKEEPKRVFEAVKKMNLKFVVLTMVTRDDLDDGGVSVVIQTVNMIKSYNKNIGVEVLVSDFDGKQNPLNELLKTDISVFNHNLETVKSLYTVVRPMASYQRSLELLGFVKQNRPEIPIKTGIMVGLGEKKEEVVKLMEDFANISGDIFTIGQYLQPTRKHYPVKEYIEQELYDYYKVEGKKMGIGVIYAGPFVRSSYHAEILYK